MDSESTSKILNVKIKRQLTYEYLNPSYKEGISSIVKEKNIQLGGMEEPMETNFLK